MSAKDFGLYFHEQHKFSVNPPIFLLPNFVFFDLSAIEPDLFSSTAQTEINGEPYALTVDFDSLMFNKLLTCIPDYFAEILRDLVDKETEYPFTMQLDQMPIRVDLRVRLGELIHGDFDDFIPMIMIDVSSPEKQLPNEDLPF